jgi:hypothetical protein
MTSLDRAKRFLADKSRVIATTIVPLAGLMLSQTPAQAVNAIPITAFNPTSCGISAVGQGVSATGSCTVVAQSSSVGGVLGAKLYADNSDLEPTASSGSGGLYGLNIFASGGTTGNILGGRVPVSWNFTPTTSDGGNVSYALVFSIFGPGGGSVTEGNIDTFNIASGTVVSGSDSIGLTGEGAIFGYSISLQVRENNGFSQGKSLTVNIPQNSLDILPTSGTPEPGSMLLLSSGFAGLLFRRFRRSR